MTLHQIYRKSDALRAASDIDQIFREAILTRRGTPEEELRFMHEQLLDRDATLVRLRAELADARLRLAECEC